MPFSGRGLLGLWVACAVVAAVAYGGIVDAFFVADDHVLLFALSDSANPVSCLPPRGSPFFRPLLALSFLGDWHLFGASARAMHLHGLVLHTLAAWLLGVVAADWTRSAMAGVGAALLFVSSPLHPEAVTWISARGYPLGACFTLVALATVRAGPLRASRLWLGGLAAAAALLAVEPALPLLAYPLALGWALRRRSGWACAAVSAAVTAAYLAVRVYWLGGLGGYRAVDGGTVHQRLDLGHALGYVAQALAHLLAPGPWDGADGAAVTGLVGVAAVLALTLLGLALADRDNRRLLPALGACSLAALSVTAGWATLGADLAGVRYLYFAAMFVGVGLAASSVSSSPRRRAVAVALLTALVLVQLVLVRVVNARWAESGALARAAVEGVAVRVAARDTSHVFLHGAPATFRGAHALPWGIEQAARVFARRDLRVDVVDDPEQFALVRRAYAESPADRRAHVDVGVWDAQARGWRWQ